MIFREEVVVDGIQAWVGVPRGRSSSGTCQRTALNRGEILELIEALEASSEAVEVLIKNRPFNI
jgi:hypothetical protein